MFFLHKQFSRFYYWWCEGRHTPRKIVIFLCETEMVNWNLFNVWCVRVYRDRNFRAAKNKTKQALRTQNDQQLHLCWFFELHILSKSIRCQVYDTLVKMAVALVKNHFGAIVWILTKGKKITSSEGEKEKDDDDENGDSVASCHNRIHLNNEVTCMHVRMSFVHLYSAQCYCGCQNTCASPYMCVCAYFVRDKIENG